MSGAALALAVAGLSSGYGEAVIVRDVTFDVEYRGLSATAGVDFPASPTTVTITAGEVISSKVGFVYLFPYDDLMFEGPEEFEVVISNASGALLPNRSAEVSRVLTIIDNDSSPVPLFTVTAVNADRAEGSGSTGKFSFDVSRPFGGSDLAGSVDWAVTGAGAHQASAIDFVGGLLPSGSIAFAPGEIRTFHDVANGLL